MRLTIRSAGPIAIAAIVLLAGAAVTVMPTVLAEPPSTVDSGPASDAQDPGALLGEMWRTPEVATPTPTDSPTPTASPTPTPTDSPTPTASPVPTPSPSPAPTAKPKPKPIPDTVAGARTYVKLRIGVKQYNCVNAIWSQESKWNPRAGDVDGAYGIPQAFPGSKMAAFGSKWRTSPITQVKWGIWYVNSQYGSGCAAWSFWRDHGWY